LTPPGRLAGARGCSKTVIGQTRLYPGPKDESQRRLNSKNFRKTGVFRALPEVAHPGFEPRDSRYHSGVTPLEKVARELERYEHPLFEFAARERNGAIELLIRPKVFPAEPVGGHIYSASVHMHDIEHSQFPWNFQRHLYDCLHDYVVEMFTRSPQNREEQT
jgi:hypothetical protein